MAGVVLGALYMLWFAQRFLFGAAKAPHAAVIDLGGREKVILDRDRRRGVRPRPVSGRADAQDRARGAINIGNRSRATGARERGAKLAARESLRRERRDELAAH